MSRPRFIALLLALATLASYLPVLRCGFVNFDDQVYVTENPVVKPGLTPAGVRWAWTTFHGANWHPLTWLSHMADCSLFGLNPGAHHFVNALLHAANAALVLVLFWRLTGKLRPAFFIAALFAWHPLHVESVAWISERKDVLSTFFALLSLLSYAKFAKENSRRDFWLAFLFFTLGLLAKPMLVTLPFVFLLLDFWPLQRIAEFKKIVAEKIPFFILTAASCVITFLAQRAGSAVATLEQIPLACRLENAPVACARYLLNTVWPLDLAVLYPLQQHQHLLLAWAAASLCALFLISWLAWRARRGCPYFITGWLWFLGGLMPVIGLVKVGSMALADRYTYMPLLGIFFAAAFGLEEFLVRRPTWRFSACAAMTIVLLACIALTEIQISFWRDSESLFRRALAVTEENFSAHLNLGAALETKGQLSAAQSEYEAAIGIAPENAAAHVNLGLIFSKTGQPGPALEQFRQALQSDPQDAQTHNAAASQLIELARFDEARREINQAEKLDSHYALPHLEAANIFFKQGQDSQAVNELKTALRLDPDNFQLLALAARFLAVNAHAEARDAPNALVLALKAQALSGRTQAMTFDILGMALAANGDFTNAAACAQNALALAAAAQLKNTGQIEARLELYKKNQPWRESFLATNAPVKN